MRSHLFLVKVPKGTPKYSQSLVIAGLSSSRRQMEEDGQETTLLQRED